METQHPTQRTVLRISRRSLLQAGLAAGAALALWPLARSPVLWGAEAGPPRRGGILRVRGRDPVHFDPQLTRNTHRIMLESDAARLDMMIEGVPSANPRTGRITAQSVIAALRRLNSPLRIGT